MATAGRQNPYLSEHYKVTLTVRGQEGGLSNKKALQTQKLVQAESVTPLTVTAYLPETFNVALSTNWDSTSSSGFGNLVDMIPAPGKVAETVKTGLKMTGGNTQVKRASRLVYGGPSHLELQIPFVFVANTNAKTEVTDPIRELLKLTASRTAQNGELMIPPGPFLEGGGEQISIKIGSMYYLDNIVVKNVSSAQNVRLDEDGNCLQAQVDVTVASLYAIDRADIEEIFALKPSSPKAFTEADADKALNALSEIGQGNFSSVVSVSNTLQEHVRKAYQ